MLPGHPLPGQRPHAPEGHTLALVRGAGQLFNKAVSDLGPCRRQVGEAQTSLLGTADHARPLQTMPSPGPERPGRTRPVWTEVALRLRTGRGLPARQGLPVAPRLDSWREAEEHTGAGGCRVTGWGGTRTPRPPEAPQLPSPSERECPGATPPLCLENLDKQPKGQPDLCTQVTALCLSFPICNWGNGAALLASNGAPRVSGGGCRAVRPPHPEVSVASVFSSEAWGPGDPQKRPAPGGPDRSPGFGHRPACQGRPRPQENCGPSLTGPTAGLAGGCPGACAPHLSPAPGAGQGTGSGCHVVPAAERGQSLLSGSPGPQERVGAPPP